MFNLENYKLKSSSFYEVLNALEKKIIKARTTRTEYKRGQVIFREGSFSKGIYIIRKGKVKIYKVNPNGLETIVYIYKKGEYFGFRPLLADEPHPTSASAMDNVVVTFIPKDVILRLFNESKNLSKHLALNLASEFSVWINKLTVFTRYSVRDRTALSLLILNELYRKKNERKVSISINRDDFASFVGTAKESLVRNLRHFKDERIISTQGTKIVINKPEQLHTYSGIG
jgi:CRP-like cAMP-binding protein